MKITNTEVFIPFNAVYGMRNAWESWDKMDTYPPPSFNSKEIHIGEKDLTLMHSLIKGGPEHRKFLRMIHVCVQVDMPRYWWSEADTYHFGTKNSTSTMHTLLSKKRPITKDLFVYCEEDLDTLQIVIDKLEAIRILYINTNSQKEKDHLIVRAKRLLPEGFLQLRVWDTNYEEIRNMYFQRRHHRLKEEWIDTFCKWVESLPYANELILFN